MATQSTTDEFVAKFPKSKAAYEKARNCFPRGTTHDTYWFTPGGVQGWRGVEADLTVLGKSLSCGVGGGIVGGRRDVMDMLDIRPDDAEWQRHKRVFHCGTWNAPPLQAAAGVAALRLYATIEEGRQGLHKKRTAAVTIMTALEAGTGVLGGG